MNTPQETPFLSEILRGEIIPPGKLAYFQARLRNRVYDLVVREFLRQEKEGMLTRADLARRIGRSPATITRWLSTPSRWTIDTVSDLMLAMKVEPEFTVKFLAELTTENSGDSQQNG